MNHLKDLIYNSTKKVGIQLTRIIANNVYLFILAHCVHSLSSFIDFFKKKHALLDIE